MKILSIIIFLTLLLWPETPRASVIKRNESSTEFEDNSTDVFFQPDVYQQQDFKNVSQEKGEPLSEMEFFHAKFLNISSSNRTNYKGNNDPLTMAGLFEGDILGIPNNKSLGKNAILHLGQRWPHGLIPYALAKTFDKDARILIAKAMVEFQLRTCIRFIPWTPAHKDYVFIWQSKGCNSFVGRVGGVQFLSLEKDCLHLGLILHELMHAVGFGHEQSRGDRDSYVNIIWSNIKKEWYYSFHKYKWNQLQSLNEAYDFGSVMHYHQYAFAINPSAPTIVAKVPGAVIGKNEYFTFADIRKINILYHCGDQVVGSAVGPASHCEDAHENCVAYAKWGECRKNSKWMRPHCMKACGLCRKNCVDIVNANVCQKWSKAGECDKNPMYMKMVCKKSCKVCT